ncbi:hypothetical protein BH20ACI4_BH20ACI4_25200 [soil metagenome]
MQLGIYDAEKFGRVSQRKYFIWKAFRLKVFNISMVFTLDRNSKRDEKNLSELSTHQLSERQTV